MKIWKNDLLPAIDADAVAREGISSDALMERAGFRLFQTMQPILNHIQPRHIVLCAGKGNNGGDALVLARWLATHWKVSVVLPGFTSAFSPDMDLNWRRIQSMSHWLTVLHTELDGSLPVSLEADVWIDGIFGTELRKAPEGEWVQYIDSVRGKSGIKWAIDVPSGLLADAPSDESKVLVAQHTFTIDRPKWSLLFDDHAPLTGPFTIVPLNLPSETEEAFPTREFFLTSDWVRSWMPARPFYGHKGTFGHVACLGGSFGKMGAIGFSGMAALHAGAGLVSCGIPQNQVSVLQSIFPALMAFPAGTEVLSGHVFFPETIRSVVLGPGMGMAAETRQWLKQAIPGFDWPVVLDADALNILAEQPTWLSFFPHNQVVLTPHPKEFDRLAGPHRHGMDRWQSARRLAQKTGFVWVLKGRVTWIFTPQGEAIASSSGTSAMATGGSGDVLSGIIGALLAAGLSAVRAACVGVYVHGIAGQLAAAQYGEAGTTAMELLSCVGPAMQKLQSPPSLSIR